MKRLYTNYQRCQQCYDDLRDWIAIQQHRSYRAELKTKEDWAAEVERELFAAQRTERIFPTIDEAQRHIYPNTQIKQCNECRKYQDEYYIRLYFTQFSEKALACKECHVEKKLYLPACAICGDRDEARHMYTTGYYDKRYFCIYEHQCIYWFNQEG